MRNLLRIFVGTFLLLGCAYDNTISKLPPLDNPKKNIYLFYSSDKILVSFLCNSIDKLNLGKCISEIEKEFIENQEEIKYIYIETQIRNSTSNFWKNSGYSLLTLTLGIFLSNSADIDYLFYIEDKNGTLLNNTSLSSSGSAGYWGVLPIYTGFIATGFGTLLNSYRNPDHLQKYCLYEEPQKIREILEAKRNEYCSEYELFLQDSFYKIEKDFFEILQEVEKAK